MGKDGNEEKCRWWWKRLPRGNVLAAKPLSLANTASRWLSSTTCLLSIYIFQYVTTCLLFFEWHAKFLCVRASAKQKFHKSYHSCLLSFVSYNIFILQFVTFAATWKFVQEWHVCLCSAKSPADYRSWAWIASTRCSPDSAPVSRVCPFGEQNNPSAKNRSR